MNAPLRQMIAKAESWPTDDQAEMLQVARDIEVRRSGAHVLSDDERTAVEEGLTQAERGELFEMDNVFREFLPELR